MKKLNFDIKGKFSEMFDKDRSSFEPNPVRSWTGVLITFFVGLVLVGLSGFYIFIFFQSSDPKDTFSKKLEIDEVLLGDVVHHFAEREQKFNSYLESRSNVIDPAE